MAAAKFGEISPTDLDGDVEQALQPCRKRRRTEKSKIARRRLSSSSKRLVWVDAYEPDDGLKDSLRTDFKITPISSTTSRTSFPRSQLMMHIPSCAETILRSEIVDMFSKMNLTHSWYAFVPSYIGQYGFLDAATRAIIKVQKDKTSPPHDVGDSGIEHYLHAVNALRQNLNESDETLITIALLCLYESRLRRRIGSCVSHRRGITAIAEVRGVSKKTSSVARAVLHGNWTQDFRTSVAEAVPSPFEDAEWVAAGPAYRTDDILPGVARLRNLAQRAYVRLPRLIALVRTLRETPDDFFDQEALDRATTLKLQLNDLQDTEAESQLLHRVHVYQTRDYQAGPIVPYSLRFKTMDEFNAALLYWGARLTVINLCTFLLGMKQNSGKVCTPELGSHHGDLETNKHRTIVNIIMSWEFTFENGLTLGSPAMTQAVLAVWHAFKGEASFNGISIKVMKRWLKDVFQESVAGWPTDVTFDEAQLDEVSGIFVGGPISGFLAGIYN